jgi:hypothetical protein
MVVDANSRQTGSKYKIMHLHYPVPRFWQATKLICTGNYFVFFDHESKTLFFETCSQWKQTFSRIWSVLFVNARINYYLGIERCR